MRFLLLSVGLLLLHVVGSRGFEDGMLEDDDFAEFEHFEADDDVPVNKIGLKDEEINTPKRVKQVSREQNGDIEDDVLVEDEDNEFEHFQDPEEFEGFQDSVPRSSEQPKITITKVPMIMHGRWEAYWVEGILCFLLVAYGMAYVIGRAKNTAIASNFLRLHKPLLTDNFTLVGEADADVAEEGRGWRREAEHCFTMWCSGRTCCEGMLLTLKLIKRQDLVHVLLNCIRPSTDTLVVRAELAKDEADPFVLCIAQKKIAARLAKEMNDISVFCPERRAGDKHGLPASLCVMSEAAEATAAILDSRVVAAISQYAQYIQYIHISDRFSGPKQIEESSSTTPPTMERLLMVGLSLSGDGDGEEMRPLLLLVLYLLDKIRRTRLSKEALAKCEKRRQLAASVWERGAHVQRQAQAAERREERRKLEKERILAEDDPEKQRRWELKEQKRQQKRKNPKMKQLKVKAL